MTWTSRERVVAALEHREPDRVPVDVNPVLDFYLNLKNYLGLEIEEALKPNTAMEVIPHPSVLSALGADVISVKLGSPSGRRSSRLKGGYKEDEWGVIRQSVRQPGGGSYLEVVHYPLADATIDDLEGYSWPDPYAPGRGEGAEAMARRLYEGTDLALLGRFGGPIVETPLYLVGWENWLVRLAREPEFAAALLDKITDIQIALDRVGLEATAKYLQIFKVSGEDLGMQTGPLYSPKMFRTLLLPRLRRRWRAARGYLDQVNQAVKIMLHSCGGIRPYIPDLIEAGIQVLDPVQPRAVGMDSAGLKRDFGDRLTFHGGVDIQEVLPFGSEEDVEAEVRRRIRAFAPGGGYILASAHNVQADVPPPNLVAMCRAAQRYGQYPIRN
jgi:uroporphyrinogen decarboxylase